MLVLALTLPVATLMVAAQVSGTRITLTTALAKAHPSGAQVAGSVPTPGAPNQYSRRPQ